MGGILRLAGLTKAIAFDGVSQYDGRTPTVLVDGMMEGCIDLVRIMATPVELVDLLIRQVLNELGCFGVLAEEILTGIGRAITLEVLKVAVTDLVHDALHLPFFVPLEQGIPVATPNDLQHVPAGTAEDTLKFLDNLAITTDWAVQTLKVAVNHKDQVAEVFPAGHGDGPQGFRLVTLAVTDKAPDLAIAHLDELPAVQVLHYVGLINGLNRAQTHGNRGELPVIRHQPGVRVGRKAGAIYLFAVLVEIFFIEPAFKIGTCIDARR